MTQAIDPIIRDAFGRKLRSWYRLNARDLPWRRTRNAYEILVSELMLQQTQVSRVVTRYGEFLEQFPTLAHVALAKPARVMEAWEGLGYYARARNLHRLASEVTDGGRAPDERIPSDPPALRALPGIGAYTAGAVASFAYERRAALVDTNVARVLKRVFAPNADLKTTKGQKTVWSIAEAIRADDVDAQPGADGVGRPGLHGADRALRQVPGERRLSLGTRAAQTVAPSETGAGSANVEET
jgi:A/G-specific adenine glycosylase